MLHYLLCLTSGAAFASTMIYCCRVLNAHLDSLDWFLVGRTQRVVYQGDISLLVWLLWGVPQGSVLGSLFFLLYTAELFGIIGARGATSHFYADDGQLYVNCPAADAEVAIRQLRACVADVDAWMKASRLRVNPQKKMQLIWQGSRQQREKLNMS